jgi:TonB family protein
MGVVVRCLIVALALSTPGRAWADGARALTILIKTLGYDDGLPSRVMANPVPLLLVGAGCEALENTLTLHGRPLTCEAVGEAQALGEATRRGGLLVLGALSPTTARSLAQRGLQAGLTVVALDASSQSPDVLLAVDGTGLKLGQQAVKRLAARFASSVLRVATLVSAEAAPVSAPMPDPTPEEASPPERLPGVAEALYPEAAREKGVEGVVVLRVGVSSTGAVSHVEVVRGDEVLAGAAVAAAKLWRYEPARLDDRPLAVSIIVKVPFRLR